MEEVILFLLSFLFIFIIYQIIIVSPAKRSKEKKTKKKKDREPIEIKYLITKYSLDIKKVNYNQLLQIVALTSSFDIALSTSLIMAVKDFFLSVVVGIVAIISLIMVSYHLVYLFYKKKGMIKK